VSKQVVVLGSNLDTWLTCSAQFSQVGKKAGQEFGILGPLLSRRSGLSVCRKRCAAQHIALPSYDVSRLTYLKVRCQQLYPEAASFKLQVPALRLKRFGTLVTGKFTRIWGFNSSQATLEHWEFRLRVSCYGDTLSSALEPTEGWLKSPTGNRSELMLSRQAEAAPQKIPYSEQRVVSQLLVCTDWGFPFFSWIERQMPFKRCTAQLPQSWRPSAKVVLPKLQRPLPKAFWTRLGPTARKSSNQNLFHKGQVAWCNAFPPVAVLRTLTSQGPAPRE
jgi:hypothetical protein